MIGFRTALLCGACFASTMPTSVTIAAEAHGKTAKQCDGELKANTAALEAAGESASAFFHACWWHTAAGEKTPIDATAHATMTESVVTYSAGAGRASRSEPAARRVRHMARWRERTSRFEEARRAPHGNEDLGPDPVGLSPAYVEGTAATAPIPVLAARSPLIEAVPVTVVGMPDMVVLSVPAGTSAMVRDILNHPAVPGLTAAP